MKEIITIRVSRFLTNELSKKIAEKQWGSCAPLWTNRSRLYIFDELVNENDCFGVVATTVNNEVVGRIHCIQNEADPLLWYYGDLFVVPEYRRRGIAKQMIQTAIDYLSEMGKARLRCYVEANNIASRTLQASLGFSEKMFEPFNSLFNDGQIMYEIDIPDSFTVIPATIHEAYFVRILFVQNKDVLNVDDIGLSEWKEFLSVEDPDEKHFLICKGAMPIAYMKINGLLNQNEAWISTLFVAKAYQHQGIGSFAIRYAERYLKGKGFVSVAIQTNINNLLAQNCYLKCGYQIYEQNDMVKFRKVLN